MLLMLPRTPSLGKVSCATGGNLPTRLVEAGKLNRNPFITQRIALDDLISKGFETRSYSIKLGNPSAFA